MSVDCLPGPGQPAYPGERVCWRKRSQILKKSEKGNREAKTMKQNNGEYGRNKSKSISYGISVNGLKSPVHTDVATLKKLNQTRAKPKLHVSKAEKELKRRVEALNTEQPKAGYR